VLEGREVRIRPQVIAASDIRSSFDIIFLAVPGHALAEAVPEKPGMAFALSSSLFAGKAFLLKA